MSFLAGILPTISGFFSNPLVQGVISNIGSSLIGSLKTSAVGLVNDGVESINKYRKPLINSINNYEPIKRPVPRRRRRKYEDLEQDDENMNISSLYSDEMNFNKPLKRTKRVVYDPDLITEFES